MENLIVYGITTLFFFFVLPVYISIYAYADSKTKYSSADFCVYRFIKFLNLNTDENRININGKRAKINPPLMLKDAKTMIENLCIFKVIQLSEYGLLSEANAYAALAQSAITIPLYKYLESLGGARKLKNYIVFNQEHGGINYSAKIVSVVNLITAAKILFAILTEKFK